MLSRKELSTMDKKDLERRLEAAEKQNLGLLDEIKNLKEKLAEMQDEPEIPDMPSFFVNERYWCSDFADKFKVWGDTFDDSINSDFSMFHTKEYADEFAKKCKIIAMMMHCKWYLCRNFKGDYSCENDKWVLCYSGLDDKFIVANSICCDYGFVSFDTIENANKCADWLNEHWRNTDEESV
jgi:hypothetical protein